MGTPGALPDNYPHGPLWQPSPLPLEMLLGDQSVRVFFAFPEFVTTCWAINASQMNFCVGVTYNFSLPSLSRCKGKSS